MEGLTVQAKPSHFNSWWSLEWKWTGNTLPPGKSPDSPSVTKHRQPHTTCWNAVTTFHAQLCTALSQLLAQHPSSVISVSGHLRHSIVLLWINTLFSPPKHSCYICSKPDLCSEALEKQKQVFKALDSWLSTATPCDGKQTSTTRTPQIQHPSLSESKPAKPLPRHSWVRIPAAGWLP